MRIVYYLLVLFIGGSASAQLTARIDVSKKAPVISDKLFGMFMENLGNEDVGNLTDDCLWSELIDDRKFFYPIDDSEILVPKNRKEAINQWKIVGGATVEMDTQNPFVGKHSPKIITNPNVASGILQSGIALVKNKEYDGYIWIKATPGLEMEIQFNDGKDISSHKITPTSTYTKFFFGITASVDTKKATLYIVGRGEGNFHVGAVSLMPSDNIDGFRPDVVKLLKDLHSSQYRWGGNFISAYDWRDGVGDRDKRDPKYEYAWECLEDNDVGTPEMIRFCELIGVDLAMTVNTGFGDATSAANWVEYVNGDASTEMGKLRASHGHEKPWNIKMWCVGNESYGWWQLGHLPLQQYIIKHNMFVEKMLEKDPALILIGSGASIEEMTVTECAKRTDGKVIPEYLSDTDWSGGMLQKGQHLDYISEHFYCSVDERFDLGQAKYVKISEPLEDWTRRPANRIKSKSIAYDEYHKRIPGSEKVPVYLDEWTYYTNWVHPKPTLGVTIGHARGLNELFRHTDLFKMAGFTFATSCLSFTDVSADYNSTGLLFKLYQEKFGRIPVSVDGNSPQPNPKWPIGGDQPKENAGGNVYPLDIVAALTSDGKSITISVINPTEKAQKLTLDFGSARVNSKGKKYTISGTSIEARNIVNQKPEVSISESSVKNYKNLEIAPATISVLEFQLQ
ncbi:alpha-N-arabinofuranosidase [Flavobacterium silvaticum]|uniref:non-reducing end alpha-L-arabinofuranosidase n=1 Tax=Flavobacterium silvaticum TaxID=1852020 RepID=A0A972JGW3_9FLAO|nr:alpha-N-arabinofuranosidase [Flavobacterium silvaticum]NMH28616.1 alpha-N-arabinofuranosidase [Flavobacterium silvaticum]